MAIQGTNPLIPLAVRVPDMASQLSQGIQSGVELSQVPRKNALLDAEMRNAELTTQTNQQAIQQNDVALRTTAGQYAYNVLANIRQLPVDQREAALTLAKNQMVANGFDKALGIADMTAVGSDVSDEWLDSQISAFQPYAAQSRAAIPAGQQEFEALIAGMSPEDQERARRISAGLDPRAVTSAPQTVIVGGVPYSSNAGAGTMTPMLSPETVADNAGTVAGGKEAGKQAVTASGKFYEQMAPVGKAITNLSEAINAIDEGADRGKIANLFPSFTEASITLDNIRGRMGLDIIGATTFGALSESELAFALDTAIPPLDEKDLRPWLEKKRTAQRKLYGELQNAAIYLGKPGNTVSGYLEKMRNEGNYRTEEDDLNDILGKYPAKGDK